MKYVTHYRRTPSRPGAEPFCFSSVNGNFESLDEAVWLAKHKALTPMMGAHSFLVEGADGQTHGPWEFEGGTWRRLDVAPGGQD